MKEAKGIQWLGLFISQIVFSPLVQVLLYKYIAVTQGWTQPYIGLISSLLFIYLIPFFVAIGVIIHSTWQRYLDINRNPYYM
jgi:hypothetical protein